MIREEVVPKSHMSLAASKENAQPVDDIDYHISEFSASLPHDEYVYSFSLV